MKKSIITAAVLASVVASSSFAATASNTLTATLMAPAGICNTTFSIGDFTGTGEYSLNGVGVDWIDPTPLALNSKNMEATVNHNGYQYVDFSIKVDKIYNPTSSAALFTDVTTASDHYIVGTTVRVTQMDGVTTHSTLSDISTARSYALNAGENSATYNMMETYKTVHGQGLAPGTATTVYGLHLSKMSASVVGSTVTSLLDLVAGTDHKLSTSTLVVDCYN